MTLEPFRMMYADYDRTLIASFLPGHVSMTTSVHVRVRVSESGQATRVVPKMMVGEEDSLEEHRPGL